MNLADWLKGDHEPSERLTAAVSLCRAVSDQSRRGLDLDPAHIQISGDGESPSDGRQGRAAADAIARRKWPRASPRCPSRRSSPSACSASRSCPAATSNPGAARCCAICGPTCPATSATPCRPASRWTRSGAPRTSPTCSVSWRAGRRRRRIERQGGGPRGTARRRLGRARQPRPSRWPRPAPVAAPRLRARRARGQCRDRGLPPASADRAAGLAAPPPTSMPLPSPVAAATPAPSPSTPGDALRRSRPPPLSAPARGGRDARRLARAFAGRHSRRPSPRPPRPRAAPPTPAPTPEPARAAEPATPAAVTNVSPPVLHRGANVLVDVHGVGLRSDHQVRVARPREAARGIEVMRQRYVGPALLQVLLRIDAARAHRRLRPLPRGRVGHRDQRAPVRGRPSRALHHLPRHGGVLGDVDAGHAAHHEVEVPRADAGARPLVGEHLAGDGRALAGWRPSR